MDPKPLPRAFFDHLLLRVAFGIGLVLIAANAIYILIADHVVTMPGLPGDIVRQMDLSREANFGAWFSSSLLLLNSLYAYTQMCHQRLSDHRAAMSYGFLSAGFMLLSIDEIIQFHEFLEKNAKRLFASNGIESALIKYTGILFTLALALTLLVLVFGSLHKFVRRENFHFLIYSIASVFIAALAESIYRYAGCHYLSRYFRLEILFEEGGELMAILFFLAFQQREIMHHERAGNGF